MIAKLLAKLAGARRELTVLAAVAAAIASANVLTGQNERYAVEAAAALAALAHLFVKNPALESKAAPPSTPAPPQKPVTPAPSVELPPLIPPPQ